MAKFAGRSLCNTSSGTAGPPFATLGGPVILLPQFTIPHTESSQMFARVPDLVAMTVIPVGLSATAAWIGFLAWMAWRVI